MTPAATAFPVEKGFTGSRIAGEDVGDLVKTPIGCEIDRRVEKRREIGCLRVGQLELRHAFVGTSDAQKLTELFAPFVGLDQDGARQVRSSAGPAAGIRAVTKGALRDEDLAATFDRRLIGGRRESLLLV